MKHFLGLFPVLTIMLLLATDSPKQPSANLASVLPYPFNLVICAAPGLDGGSSHSPLHCVTPVTPEVNSLPAPKLMEGIGYSDLKITTSSEKARQYFSQGMALIYDFWFFEAYRAFKYAAELDPEAAMPHFGIALSLHGGESAAFDDARSQKLNAIKKADSLKASATPKEQLYIESFLALVEAEDRTTGEEAFAAKMKQLIQQYPDDSDSKLLFWLYGDTGYKSGGTPKKNTLLADYLLKEVMRTQPEHPGAHHFWIHQMEAYWPDKALESAEILASLAPNSGHMVHMPGHIYWRLGQYKKARQTFLASLSTDSTYMAQQNIPSISVWNYHHNLHFLLANSLEEGRFEEAEELFERNLSIGTWTGEQQDNLKGMTTGRYFRSFGATREDLLFRLERWEEAVNIYKTLADDLEEFTEYSDPVFELMTSTFYHYAKGMHALEKGKINAAKWEVDAMDAKFYRAANQEEPGLPSGIPLLEGELKMYSLLLKAAIAAENPKKFEKAEAFYLQALEVQNSLEYQEPPRVWKLAHEEMGWFYLDHNMPDKAIASFEEGLKERPNSGFLLYGLAEAYRAKADEEMTTQHYSEFLEVWANADEDLPQLKRAEKWLSTK